jgi:hypothetical protein
VTGINASQPIVRARHRSGTGYRQHGEIAGSEKDSRPGAVARQLTAEFEQIDALLASEQAKVQAQQDALKLLDTELRRIGRAQRIEDSAIGLEAERPPTATNSARSTTRKHDLVRGERLSAEKLHLEDQHRALVPTRIVQRRPQTCVTPLPFARRASVRPT